MTDCNPASTPMESNIKLMKATEADELADKERYTSCIGSLLYLSCKTRPDITFAVSYLARFSSAPTAFHWTAVKRLLRYLKGTSNYGLVYSRSNCELLGYCDADYAGDQND